ncbi:MAG: hypothetical protein GF355_00780 [Candidatus Eisenbacteria bacterium]|nr:hypothetical protein [Candidatus Eisenbacteria bacterium]
MRRLGSTREILLMIIVAAAGIVVMAMFVPGRNEVMAPCEVLPAQRWELQETEQGWQGRLRDYRRGGTIRVVSYDLGGPARVSIVAPDPPPPSQEGERPAGTSVSAGQLVARIQPAAVEGELPQGPVGRYLSSGREITTPISGRFRLGDGAICQVENLDTLVVRIRVSQQEPLTITPGEPITIQIGGFERLEASVLPVPAGIDGQTGEWEIYAELDTAEGLTPGLRGFALTAWGDEGFPGILWTRFKEQLRPRLQRPQ